MQNHLWSQSRLSLPHRARPLQHPPPQLSGPRRSPSPDSPAQAHPADSSNSNADPHLPQPASRHSSANTCPHWATIMTGFQAREGQVDQGLQWAGRPWAKRLTS